MTVSVSLRHQFDGFALDVAFEAPGGVTALFGRSGSGKTTVVNAVAGLLRPDAGRVSVDGRVLVDRASGVFVPPHRRRVGYVFQEGRLFPHMSVRRNLEYGARLEPRGEAGARFDDVVAMLGLGALLDRGPSALSGGEKQRVAVGRALLSKPKLLLMDDPLAALDEARKEEILPYLERLRDETAVPVLYVSHSVAEVARLATTVVMLNAGRVVRVGPVGEVMADPDAVPGLGVREAGAVLAARVVAHHEDGLSELAISGGPLFLPRIEAAVGTGVRVRIHAQDVMLARDKPGRISALNVLAAEVVSVRLGEGPGAIVQLKAGADLILARVTRRSVEGLDLRPGVACFAVLKSVAVGKSDVGGGGVVL